MDLSMLAIVNDEKNNDKKRIPISLLENILTLISKNKKLVLSKVQ
jgi:hypothetical protein